MPLRINRKLFDRVKDAIAETMRVDTRHWAKIEGCEAITSVTEIRALLLSSDCGTVACIGGWTCFLATEEEIASAIKAYGLSGLDVNEPFTLAAALLLGGADDIYALEKACSPLFFGDCPAVEDAASADCRPEKERVQAALRRMNDWAMEIETRRAGEGR